jgi:hypothetical protein
MRLTDVRTLLTLRHKTTAVAGRTMECKQCYDIYGRVAALVTTAGYNAASATGFGSALLGGVHVPKVVGGNALIPEIWPTQP